MEEETKYIIGSEISSGSSREAAGEAPAGSLTPAYSFSNQESRILSEFGWNLQAEESGDRSGRADGGLEPFDSFLLDEPSDSTGTFQLPENLPSSRQVSEPPSAEMARSSVENPLISSSSSDELAARPAPEPERRSTAEISKKAKTKGEKRCHLPRVAFLTKSEVDHLEDGYRWRKYGQKAVKNSSFPRSYYRCTNNKCMVKKRVERCHKDPTIVITTYEGQHSHHAIPLRRGCTITSPAASTSSSSSSFSSSLQLPFNIYTLPTALIHDHFQPHDTSFHDLPRNHRQGRLHDLAPPRMQNR